MAGFFPVFFKDYWCQGLEATRSSFLLGLANSLASVCVALSAPFLGALADRTGTKKRLLLAFAGLGILFTAGLSTLGEGQWWWAAVFYCVASVGFAGGNVFYDALLLSVARAEDSDRISALGYALGYLGGGLLFLVCVVMTLAPGWFGLEGAAAAVRLSFVLVAVWWASFSIPLFRRVPEPAVEGAPAGSPAISAWRRLRETLGHLGRHRVVVTFLVGYWLYIDGVDTVIRMAVDYGLSLGFPRTSLLTALLVTQFVGFPSALLFGRLGQGFGTRRALYLALLVYVLVTVYGYFMDEVVEFYVLAVAVGLVQGGVQSLSRSLFSRLVPRNHAAEFFGFYNLLGKFAAVLGPLLMGGVAEWTGHSRAAILAILPLFLLGALVLSRVDEEEGRRQAARTEGRAPGSRVPDPPEENLP
jgi:UMF1 family MFS transporter